MNQKNSKINKGPHFAKAYKNLSFLQKFLLFALLIFLIFISFPIVLLLIFGLLPTITIMYTDRQNYDKQLIIGCFNISGVFFYLFGLLSKFSLGLTNNIADNIFMLIVMLGCAAIGVLVYSELPNLYAYFYKISAQKRIERIDAKLNKLREEWGDDIAGSSLELSDNTSK